MKLKYKILLYTSNHITGNLVSLKLKSFGHDVSLEECSQRSLDLIKENTYDLLVVDDAKNSSDEIESSAKSQQVPLIYTCNKKYPDHEKEKYSIVLSFSEEDFLHKVSYAIENLNEKKKLPLQESILSHYAGDRDLAQRVIKSFLECWEESFTSIEDSFANDDDKDLARKIHSFKGVLSALGETEAAVMIRKIEILVKGRNRDLAQPLFGQLHGICTGFAKELEASVLLK